MEERIKNLIRFAQGIYHKENVKELYATYLTDIEQVTPQEVFLVEYEQLKMGLSPREILTCVDKLINVFYKSLSAYLWDKPQEDSFLYMLMEENKGLSHLLDDFKKVVKEQDYKGSKDASLIFLKEVQKYNAHLLKLENILFPYMEKNMERFNGLKIMWSLHDLVRDDLKTMIEHIEKDKYTNDSFNIDIGQLFFSLYGLIQKQELILFPSATDVLSKEDFKAMYRQSFEYDFPYIQRPEEPIEADSKVTAYNQMENLKIVPMQTGSLSFEQVENMINTLPIDITFVDENDKVAFFSRPAERLFPRSVAVIGRDVRNCHPPESVHIVEQILSDFKEGYKNQENFWIQMRGNFVLIQYFAVRNEVGQYLGTLEASQEISHIQKLEGEKRLLD